MKQDGISLIEILVVVAITSLLLLFAGIEYKGWIARYNAENQIREMHVDLMNARLRAMDKNRTHFVSQSSNQYTVYDDTNPSPNGNGTLESASDTRVLQKDVNLTIAHNGAATIEFNSRGLANNQETICIRATENPVLKDKKPAYDCIVVSWTRICVGKLTNNEGNCDADNCKPK